MTTLELIILALIISLIYNISKQFVGFVEHLKDNR